MLRVRLGVSIWAQMGPIGLKRAEMGPIGHFGRMPKMPTGVFRANAQNAQLGPFGPVWARLGSFGTNLQTSPLFVSSSSSRAQRYAHTLRALLDQRRFPAKG